MKKACILAAGFGSRLNFSKFSNKALLPVGNRAAISIIMDSIPLDVEIVIAVNYMKEDLIDYLELVEFERKIEFIEVSRISGPGSGPGLSLMECGKALQEPFVLFACDSIPLSNINFSLDHNWIATSKEIETINYLNVSRDLNDYVNKYYDKIRLSNEKIQEEKISSFSGIAGIFNYSDFFNGLESQQNSLSELQVTPGLENLIAKKIKVVDGFDWVDVGNENKYQSYQTKLNFPNQIQKDNEFIYFEKDNTIKFFSSAKKSINMKSRIQYLNGTNPPGVEARGRFLKHKFVQGILLSEVKEKDVMKEFLCFMNEKLWNIKSDIKIEHKSIGESFYKSKTQDRIDLMINQNNIATESIVINDTKIPSLENQIKNVNWKELFNFEPTFFHGDPQPENVIYSNKNWTLIDWRDTFGERVDYGDTYYDLSKIYHALFVSGQSVRLNKFKTIILDRKSVFVDIEIQENHKLMIDEFEEWVKSRNLSLLKIRELSALILLNIAPLHDKEYGTFLYYYGRYLLELNSKGRWINKKYDYTKNSN